MSHGSYSGRALRLCLFMLLGSALVLAGCAPPATLKKRAGYWADQKRPAQAYNQRVRFLVLHYSDGSEARALNVLTGASVSAHYVVPAAPPTRGGRPIVHQLVAESERAWHAGVSRWASRRHINDSSIGIELVNAGPIETPRGRAWQPYTEAQVQSLVILLRDLIARYDIEPQNVFGHADVAPGRKIDPGPAFPWHRLYRAGIGAWPDPASVATYRRKFSTAMPDIRAIQTELARYGYAIEVTSELDQQTHAALTSFQMHFRPSRYDGRPDAETAARLWALNDKYR